MDLSVKCKSTSAKLGLVAAAAALVSLIAFLIYGAMYSAYADYGVGLFLALGLAAYVAYILFDGPVFDFMPLIGVFCSSFGIGLFAINAYPVLGDWYGNFNMYGSQGGITPVVVILVITLISILFGIITSFTRKHKEVK